MTLIALPAALTGCLFLALVAPCFLGKPAPTVTGHVSQSPNAAMSSPGDGAGWQEGSAPPVEVSYDRHTRDGHVPLLARLPPHRF